MPKLKQVWILPSFTKIRDPAARQWAKELSLLLTDLIRDIALADELVQVQEFELIKGGNKGGQDGNLKFSYDGVNILEQLKVDGTWTTVRTIFGS